MVKGSVTLVDVNSGEEKEVKTDGVFVYIGMLPLSKPFVELGITNENGYLETNERMETKIPGIFALVMFVKNASSNCNCNR